jgi:DNA invertase Pin-like site-specific DNA recombinase
MDTSTPTGKLMLTVLGRISEFECEIMLERQREGIAKAKLRTGTKDGSRSLATAEKRHQACG